MKENMLLLKDLSVLWRKKFSDVWQQYQKMYALISYMKYVINTIIYTIEQS